MDKQKIRKEIDTVLSMQTDEQNLDEWQQLCVKYPDSSEVWLEYALSLDRLSKEVDAIPIYKKALYLGLQEEQKRIALICLASSYRNVGQFDEALETINEARQLFAEDPVVNCFYALILHDAGSTAKAIQVLGLTLVNVAKPEALKGFEEGLKYKFNEMHNE